MDYYYYKQKCKEKGYSPCRFAIEILGISKSNVTNWKKGGNPRCNVLIKMAEILDCSTDNLLGINRKDKL